MIDSFRIFLCSRVTEWSSYSLHFCSFLLGDVRQPLFPINSHNEKRVSYCDGIFLSSFWRRYSVFLCRCSWLDSVCRWLSLMPFYFLFVLSDCLLYSFIHHFFCQDAIGWTVSAGLEKERLIRQRPQYALGKFENVALILRLGLPSTLIHGAFRKRSSNWRNLKTSGWLCFLVCRDQAFSVPGSDFKSLKWTYYGTDSPFPCLDVSR